MAALVMTAALIVSGVDGSPWAAVPEPMPAVRVVHGCTSDPLCTGPPPVTAPPGAHCPDLLPAFIDAGGQPEDFTWYGNVSWGEAHCRTDAHNGQLSGGTWGPMQISYGSWAHLCGLGHPADLYDPATTFRCAFAIEAAGGRRQWSPHNTITGCFPRGIGTPC